jgi:two-component system OmpR family response regulator
MKLLLVEDERKIADFVIEGLETRGVDVEQADNGHTGCERALSAEHDVIVLDIMLPGRDGLSILCELRKKEISTPVLLLTARNELGDRVKGLELGADDYLAKPFYVEELYARVQALTRRDRQSSLQVGEIRLDRVSREASYRGHAIELTGREFSLLEYLMRSPGEVFTRSQILEHVWGYDFDPSTNVVDVCIKRIRAKMEVLVESPGEKSPIEAVRGAGYRFRLSP